jgi:hypothetical protein
VKRLFPCQRICPFSVGLKIQERPVFVKGNFRAAGKMVEKVSVKETFGEKFEVKRTGNGRKL